MGAEISGRDCSVLLINPVVSYDMNARCPSCRGITKEII